MTIEASIHRIAGLKDCRVLPPSGELRVAPGVFVPGDLQRFYAICGGAVLYENSVYPATIVPPERVIRANAMMLGEPYEDDISANWYVVVDVENGDYLTVDFSKERLGFCYDSSAEGHGLRGSCPIIATSFSSLLEQLISNKGEYWFWLRDDFVRLGDAYDGVPEG